MKNAVNWFELPARNFERAVKFYSALLNARLHVEDLMGTPNAIFPSGEPGAGGSIVRRDGDQPSTSGTIVYLNVEGDLDGALARTEPAGGKVVLPRTHIGKDGYIAIIVDSEGNRVGLHSPN
jgi:predicted enzyme related to lactoylglutathione lyase